MLENIKRSPDLAEFVIQGVTRDGAMFRPSNWNERLSDMLSTTGKDGRAVYSSYVHPATIQGLPSVVVRFSLETADPKGFEQVRQFVVGNQLQVRAGRGGAVPMPAQRVYTRPSVWNAGIPRTMAGKA